MNSSFPIMIWGLRDYICTKVAYKSNTIILNVERKSHEKVCPRCKTSKMVRNGYRIREFIGLPIGRKKVILRVKIQRYKCKEAGCGYDRQENIPFANGSCRYTHSFARYVVDLLMCMTLVDASRFLDVGWDMLKDIHTKYLKRHYSPPSLTGVENIGIDEFAVRKGHVYKTIVVDLDTGRILYVGNGKGADALEKFWKRMRKKCVRIRHIATDLSPAYISSVMDNCPDAVHVFDHFHVVKLMNDKLDKIRRQVFQMEKNGNKRIVFYGIRYLLLKNGEDIFDKDYKTRLENALQMNLPLSQAYYLKEQLREIWTQTNKQEAFEVIKDWVRQANESKIPLLKKMAATLMAFRTGILAWFDCHISTAKVEGINNKIKVLKRKAYGYSDDNYLKLRLFALHDSRITPFY